MMSHNLWYWGTSGALISLWFTQSGTFGAIRFTNHITEEKEDILVLN